ncbi:hypothetical protein Fcan01_17155 [Folsomia candida]|uniref:Uncharacterized protein n=1 Tax=Folsomia candida TaxID=158441 RepID=A0A226DT77_FOLCA|nr:hypothetical protein Fcan01_17155 [Folsomia candida]
MTYIGPSEDVGYRNVPQLLRHLRVANRLENLARLFISNLFPNTIRTLAEMRDSLKLTHFETSSIYPWSTERDLQNFLQSQSANLETLSFLELVTPRGMHLRNGRILAIVAIMPKLSMLRLGLGCRSVIQLGRINLPEQFPSLTTLTIHTLPQRDEKGLNIARIFSSNLPHNKLTALELPSGLELSIFSRLGNLVPNLKHLSLNGQQGAGIRNVIVGCSSLEVLWICGNPPALAPPAVRETGLQSDIPFITVLNAARGGALLAGP